MIKGDFAVVTSSCCKGHPIGSVVEIVDTQVDGEGFLCYECEPVRNSTFKVTLWHCDACLVKISPFTNPFDKE